MSSPPPPPPALVALAAHPLRWRLLTELGRSDRRVSELTAATGEPQNLVSYHLGQLRRAALVTARRSRADGRDTYYAPDLVRLRSSLVTAGTALHPGLRLTPAPREVRPASEGGVADPPAPSPRVLFLCTGNSARSQIAEALATHRSGGWVEAHSAGSHPKAMHPGVARVLHDEYGIELIGARPKHLDEFADRPFDRVITLCDRVREICPEFPGASAAHWSIPDPSATGHDLDASYPAFVATAAELDTRIEFLLAALTTPPGPNPGPSGDARPERPDRAASPRSNR